MKSLLLQLGVPLAIALATGAFVPVSTAGTPPRAADPIARMLEQTLARGALARASVGVLVVRADDGSVVFARGADQLFVPASNQKLLTVLAALERFGPSHRFATRVYASGSIDGEGEVGELLVEGGGDPAMNSEEFWRLAADLRREGLRVVRGDLRIDDSLFAGPAWHPSWGVPSARAYHAPIGALSANLGAFSISVWPRAAVGSTARVAVDPPVDYVRLRNRARTLARRARSGLVLERLPGAASEGIAEEIVLLDGGLRRGDPGEHIPRSVLDPGLYAGSLLFHQLEAIGVEVEGRVRRAPRLQEPLVLLLERRGRPLAEIARVCLKQSSNVVAETLVKDLAAWADGAPEDPPSIAGDWAGGIREMRAVLEALGLDLSSARLVDGSGLSLGNRLSPRMLVAALRAGRASFRFGPEFVAALPIAARDGTLERRLEQGAGRVRAKTGLLADAGVTALSGYAQRADGEELVFSILANGAGGGTEAGMEAVDALVEVLLEAPLAPAPALAGAGERALRTVGKP